MRPALLLLFLTSGALAAETPDPPSKKELLLADKAARPDVHLVRAPSVTAVFPVSLFNLHTLEVLPVDPAAPPPPSVLDRFLRCHYTNQATTMDPRPFRLALAAAARFRAQLVQVVSGYRAPKYNLMLRKKGHQVGRESQHPMGHALDFRLPGIATKLLLRYVRAAHLGGVGYYPDNEFVHADVGPPRFWRGK